MIRRRPRRINKCKLYTRWFKCAQEKGAIGGTVYVNNQTPTQHLIYFEPRVLLPFSPPLGTHLPTKILHPDSFCNPPTPSGGIVIGTGVLNALSFATLKSYAQFLRCPPSIPTTVIDPSSTAPTPAQLCTLYTQAFQCLIQKGWLQSINFPNATFSQPNTGSAGGSQGRQFTVPEAWCMEISGGVTKQRHSQMMLELGSIRQWCQTGGQTSHGALPRRPAPRPFAPPKARGGNWTVRPDGTKVDRRGRPITKATHKIVGGTCYGCGDCGGVGSDNCLNCDHGTEKCLDPESRVALKHQGQMRKGRGVSIGRGLSQSNIRARYGRPFGG